MPRSIVLAERLVFLSLIIGLLMVATGYREAVEEVGVGAFLMILLFGFGITIAVTLWMTRGRSRIAKWIFIALFVVGAGTGAPRLIGALVQEGPSVIELTELVQTVLQGVAVWLVYRPDAKAWFDRKDALDATVFD